MTSICAVSDLHGHLPTVPEADILVVAGDISPLAFDRDVQKTMDWFESDFTEWMRSTPHKYRLFIAGNHDFAIQAEIDYFQQYVDPEDMRFLHDTWVNLDGLIFYGLPWVPNLKNWAFCADHQTLGDKYRAVPKDSNVVISHSPPYGIGDALLGADAHTGGTIHAGAYAAEVMIDDIAPKHFICGHIHEGYGHYYCNDTEVWNVATLDVAYQPVNKPVVFEYEAEAEAA